MSGTLVIRDEDDAAWMPTNWIFNGVLQDVATELEPEDPALAARLHEGQTGIGSGYCDLRSLDSVRFRRLLHTVERAYERRVAQGPSAFYQPTAYPWYLWTFSELKALLRVDSRVAKKGDSVGRLVMTDDVIWTAPGSIFDLALEHLAAKVLMEDSPLAATLLAARTSTGADVCDLRELEPSRFRWLIHAAEHMAVRYGDGQGRDSYSSSFFRELAPYARELCAQLGRDPRARERTPG